MTKQPTDDVEIIALMKDVRTAEQGFKHLLHKYQERLYWHIRRMVAEHADADDVLQNVLIKVYQSIGGFKGEAKLYTWLHRIATNESINFLNRKKRQQSDALESDHTAAYAQRLTADPYFEGDEVQLRLQAVMQTLPDKQRLVFNMRYFEERSYQEMAELLDTSVGALKASYHHAVKKIEAHFLDAKLSVR
jgi:RNA polymerase sigma factor (sigma-70 family)